MKNAREINNELIKALFSINPLFISLNVVSESALSQNEYTDCVDDEEIKNAFFKPNAKLLRTILEAYDFDMPFDQWNVVRDGMLLHFEKVAKAGDEFEALLKEASDDLRTQFPEYKQK